jgi:hypothetical protein
MRHFYARAAMLSTAFLSVPSIARAEATTVIYRTKSIVELRGQVEVADFAYTPANPKHKPDQIPNTAIGSVRLGESIGAFLANGLRQELRTSGVSLQPGGRCRLGGTIKVIRIDDLGLDSDFSLVADYVLTGADGGEIFRKEQSTLFRASKFGGGLTSISLLFSNNINAVLGSDGFIKPFEASCPRTGE